MNQARACPRCGAQLSEASGAKLCPACLIEAALEDPGESPPEDSPQDLSSRTTLVTGDVRAEQTIGGYRLLHKLGEGGMGVVWEAEQDNPRRRVALKIARAGPLADKELVRLFRREVQALARLKHRSIAAIYDAGSTPDGQHWFAMELVRGLTLGEYLQKHSPGLEERLALFLQICQAVSYAHQRAVLHRDLKPSNLVVLPRTEADSGGSLPTPQVKVLDFGLARVTEADIAITTVVTEVGQIRGTLPYMSPEQVLGNPDAIDVRSDIYSLGVVLCEMVTGQLPYEIHVGSLHQAIRVIVEEPPRLAGESRLDPDLETIIFKALEKEPERRYAGAAGLGADVERFLTDQPILARPPSTIYQLRKLMVRHKTVVGFSAVLLVLLVGFAILMTVQSVRIAQQRDRALVAEEQATNEARTSQQVTELMVGLFEAADPGKTRGDTITAREVLDQGAEDLEASLEGEPAVQSRLQQVIGRVYLALGLLTPAEEYLEAALEKQRGVYGDQSLEVAGTLYEIAELSVFDMKYREAIGPAKEALEIRRRLLEDNLVVAESLQRLGYVRNFAGLHDQETEEMLRQALEIRRQHLGSNHVLVADSLQELGSYYSRSQRLEEGERLLKESLDMSRSLLEPDDPRMIKVVRNLSIHYFFYAHNPDQAEPYMRENLRLQEKIYGKGHPSSRGGLLAYAGHFLVKKGRFQEAERLFREAWEARDPLEVSLHRVEADDPGFLSTWALCAWSLGNYEEGEELFRQGNTGQRMRSPITSKWFALMLVERGKLAQAQQVVERSLEGVRGKQLAEPLFLSSLAKVLQARGKQTQAREAFLEAENLLRENLKRLEETGTAGQVAGQRGALGDCLKGLARYEEAEPLLLEFHAHIKEQWSERNAQTRVALRDVVALYEDWGKPEEAARYRVLLQSITPNRPRE